MKRWSLVACSLCIGMSMVACGDDDNDSNEGSSSVNGPSGDDAAFVVTISGGVFAEPTTFTIDGDDIRTNVFDDSISLLFTPTTPVVGSDGSSALGSFTLSTDAPSLAATFSQDNWTFQFNVEGTFGGAETTTVSIADEEESGDFVVDSLDNDVMVGTFDTRGRATQLDMTEPVYDLQGTFRLPY